MGSKPLAGKMKQGVSEPYYEKAILKAMGIMKLEKES